MAWDGHDMGHDMQHNMQFGGQQLEIRKEDTKKFQLKGEMLQTMLNVKFIYCCGMFSKESVFIVFTSP